MDCVTCHHSDIGRKGCWNIRSLLFLGMNIAKHLSRFSLYLYISSSLLYLLCHWALKENIFQALFTASLLKIFTRKRMTYISYKVHTYVFIFLSLWLSASLGRSPPTSFALTSSPPGLMYLGGIDYTRTLTFIIKKFFRVSSKWRSLK